MDDKVKAEVEESVLKLFWHTFDAKSKWKSYYTDEDVQEAVKDVESLVNRLIETSQVSDDALLGFCIEFANVRDENGTDYMLKWFSRNKDRLAKLGGRDE